jgi:hypothetical protein
MWTAVLDLLPATTKAIMLIQNHFGELTILAYLDFFLSNFTAKDHILSTAGDALISPSPKALPSFVLCISRSLTCLTKPIFIKGDLSPWKVPGSRNVLASLSINFFLFLFFFHFFLYFFIFSFFNLFSFSFSCGTFKINGGIFF